MPRNKKVYHFAVGRRKSSVVTIKLFDGQDTSTVNKIALEKYFPGKTFKDVYLQPFVVTKSQKKYHFQAKASGGGKKGQVEALALAIARTLKLAQPDFKQPLRQAGLLTVDSRVRQRRMVGTGGKARRKKQSPKR